MAGWDLRLENCRALCEPLSHAHVQAYMVLAIMTPDEHSSPSRPSLLTYCIGPLRENQISWQIFQETPCIGLCSGAVTPVIQQHAEEARRAHNGKGAFGQVYLG